MTSEEKRLAKIAVGLAVLLLAVLLTVAVVLANDPPPVDAGQAQDNPCHMAYCIDVVQVDTSDGTVECVTFSQSKGRQGSGQRGWGAGIDCDW